MNALNRSVYTGVFDYSSIFYGKRKWGGHWILLNRLAISLCSGLKRQLEYAKFAQNSIKIFLMGGYLGWISLSDLNTVTLKSKFTKGILML